VNICVIARTKPGIRQPELSEVAGKFVKIVISASRLEAALSCIEAERAFARQDAKARAPGRSV